MAACLLCLLACLRSLVSWLVRSLLRCCWLGCSLTCWFRLRECHPPYVWSFGALQFEEPANDSSRLVMCFTAAGLPLSVGAEELASLETTYDIMFATSADKNAFIAEVGAPFYAAPCLLLRLH